jgi:hypothetical protein
MKNRIEIGTVLAFTNVSNIREYGKTAIVTNVQEVESSPFGHITTWVDAESSNGTKIQWPLSWWRKRASILITPFPKGKN